MASIELRGDELCVGFSRVEQVFALHGEVRLPVSAVRRARATETPFSDLRGMRAPGLAWPNRVALGVWRGRRHKDLAALRSGVPAVVVDLEGAEYDRVLVSAPDAPDLARRISAAAGGHRPRSGRRPAG